MMHINFGWFTQTHLVLVGVFAQIVGSVARSLFRRPRQQEQIDRIEQTVNDTLGQIAPLLTAKGSSSHVSADSQAGKA